MAAVAPIISGTPPLSALNALQGLSRSSVVAVGVVCLHILLFWTLQSGLLRRTPEVIVPVQMTSEFVPPPAANLTPSTFPPAQTKLQTAKPKSMATVAPPQPFAIADPTPAPRVAACRANCFNRSRGAFGVTGTRSCRSADTGAALKRCRLPAKPAAGLPRHEQTPQRAGSGHSQRHDWR